MSVHFRNVCMYVCSLYKILILYSIIVTGYILAMLH